ncbi:hypothetical protein FRX31_012168 [Thalictrum thalictroides]|uniref:Uncharacterized protein n=1 Tax=Thalictrum thalictroides TaxID=46969 RepID=A0A7J6WP67_THATH|nr:hypothetical protein FRX31_012168 [Thalictrum thalictroides]
MVIHEQQFVRCEEVRSILVMRNDDMISNPQVIFKFEVHEKDHHHQVKSSGESFIELSQKEHVISHNFLIDDLEQREIMNYERSEMRFANMLIDIGDMLLDTKLFVKYSLLKFY